MKIKTLCVIPLSLFVIMPCLATLKAKKIPNNVKNNSERVTNWDNHQLPTDVPVDVLETVLKNIDLYKRNEYYPFYRNMSSLHTYDEAEVTIKIIEDAVTEHERQKKSEEVKNVRDFSLFITTPGLKLSLPVSTNIKSYNHERMVDNILNALKLSNQIDKNVFYKARRIEKLLFRTQYKFLHVREDRRLKEYIKNFAWSPFIEQSRDN